MNKTLKIIILAVAAFASVWLVADTYLSITAESRKTDKTIQELKELRESIDNPEGIEAQ